MFLIDWFYGILASLGLYPKEAKILFWGLNNAGREFFFAFLSADQELYQNLVNFDQANWHRLLEEKCIEIRRTQRISEDLCIGNIKFKLFDLGGHQIARRVLNDYYAKVDAVVCLVCPIRIRDYEESGTVLHALLSDESLANVPFLILGNMDSADKLSRRLGLPRTTGRPLKVFTRRFGPKRAYSNGFKWLSQYIK